MDILVLGVGNLLLKDEAVGVKVLEAVERTFELPPEVELMDGGTAGMELLGYIQGRDALIILDAVRCGSQPGSVIRLAGEQVPALFRSKISPHQLGISDLLATARFTDTLPEKLVLFGVEPEDMGTGLELSPKVAGVVDEVALLVALELEGLGVTVTPRQARRTEPEHVVACAP